MVSRRFTWKTVMSILALCGQSAVSRAFLSSRRSQQQLLLSQPLSHNFMATRLLSGGEAVQSSADYSTPQQQGDSQPEKEDITLTNSNEKTWLVVGDGDLSYSASIAERLERSNTRLIASVLEDQELHQRVYQNSEQHSETIASYKSHKVHFGIDATQLLSHFPGDRFNVIEFNFPHWRGKNNNRHNRALLDTFLQSASTVLEPTGGEIRIALAEGQGGIPVSSLAEWRQSWMAPMYAAEHQLLLSRVESYEPEYSLSSHRGVDRSFRIGSSPQRYIFRFANGESVDPNIQLSCRHELRVMLHPDRLLRDDQCHRPSYDDIVQGTAVQDLAQEFVPPGIRFEIPARNLLTPDALNNNSDLDKARQHHVPLAVFLLSYSGESVPLTRDQSDTIRANIETAIVDRWNLQIAKANRLVSRPYPSLLTDQLIKEY